MQIALFGHSGYDRTATADSVLLNICSIIHKKRLGLYISDELFYSFSKSMQNEVREMCILFDVLPPVNLALSVGGDGTFLHTAASIGDTGIPILGINAGRLGFLADVNPDSFEEVLDEIIIGNYRIQERTLLEITTEDVTTRLDNVHALNEVAVLKQDTSSMLAIHAYINDEYFTTYQADGLVIATPTGSTAYSLSIGGSILMPTSSGIIISAVAPHSLTTRPLVVENDSRIKLQVESRSRHYLVSMDGQSHIFNEKVMLEVFKANYTLKVIKRNNHTFFETLRDKLMWGKDLRT